MFENLTSRQKTFVLEYVKIKNATKAAIAAGYSARSAEVQGSRLLSNSKIQEAITQLENKNMADIRVLLLDESKTVFQDMLVLANELKKEVKSNPDVRKQRLLFDMLSNMLDRAGYKATDKIQAEVKQETNNLFEGMTKQELLEYIKKPSIKELIQDNDEEPEINSKQ